MNYERLMRVEQDLQELFSNAHKRKDGPAMSAYHYALKSLRKEFEEALPTERTASSIVSRLNAELSE